MSPGAPGPCVHAIHLSKGGVPKLPVLVARVDVDGVEGDAHTHTEVHGGPRRAVCLYALERITALQAEGHPIAPGTTGENITTQGLDFDKLKPGTRMRLGADVMVEITDYTAPCKTIRASFADGDFERIRESTHPGWSRLYARVLRSGTVAVGCAIEVVDDDVG